MNKSNIILIGMPASGKSTCGVLAAKALLKNFYDTDLLLQGLEGNRLQDIIDNKGIDYFKQAEENAILSLNVDATVIATGGSVVYSENAMAHLKSLGKVVYLHLSFEQMVARLNDVSTRGVALKKGETLEDMYNERLPLYKKYADVIIECDNQPIEYTVERIVKSV